MGYGQYSNSGARGRQNPLAGKAPTVRRQVYPTTEIPHKWVHATQEAARNAQGNLYFRGDTIYSYRDSWPLARIYRKADAVLVLTNSGRYSVTTAGQQSAVNQAVRHLERVAVPIPAPGYGHKFTKDEHARNLAHLMDTADEHTRKAGRAMTEANARWEVARARESLAAAGAYMKFFGIRRKAPAMPEAVWAAALARAARIANPDPASLDKRERASAARRAAKLVRDQRAAELRTLHDAARRSNWRLFGAFGMDHYRAPGPVMLRQCETSLEECIETSAGARIPLAAAPMVWNLVERAVRAGGWDSVNLRQVRAVRVGDYPLDRIDADGTLHAGCHTIPYSELSSMARALGLS
jgi:hypothetical protein